MKKKNSEISGPSCRNNRGMGKCSGTSVIGEGRNEVFSCMETDDGATSNAWGACRSHYSS